VPAAALRAGVQGLRGCVEHDEQQPVVRAGRGVAGQARARDELDEVGGVEVGPGRPDMLCPLQNTLGGGLDLVPPCQCEGSVLLERLVELGQEGALGLAQQTQASSQVSGRGRRRCPASRRASRARLRPLVDRLDEVDPPRECRYSVPTSTPAPLAICSTRGLAAAHDQRSILLGCQSLYGFGPNAGRVDHGLPFSTWSLLKLVDFLVTNEVVHDISHEGLRLLLGEEGVSFQAVKTWKTSTDRATKVRRTGSWSSTPSLTAKRGHGGVTPQ